MKYMCRKRWMPSGMVKARWGYCFYCKPMNNQGSLFTANSLVAPETINQFITQLSG
jgi:hypothetical protein